MVAVEGLRHEYIVNGGSFQTLQDVSLVLSPGTVTAVYGKQGSGKSTLLGVLAGLENATAGRITLEDVDSTSLSLTQQKSLLLRRVGRVHPTLSLVSSLSVQENIELKARILGLPVDQAYLEAVVHAFDISRLLDINPQDLGPGEQQRVAFARAFLPQPDLVVADDPTARLQSSDALDLMATLKRAAHTLNQTVLFSASSVEDARTSDHLLLLDRGVVALEIDNPADHQIPQQIAGFSDDGLPGSLDEIAPPRPLSEVQAQLIKKAQRILDDLPGPIPEGEAPF